MFWKKKKENKIILNEVREEIKANIEVLKQIDGIKQKDIYDNAIKNIKILNDVHKELKGDFFRIDLNMLLNTAIVSSVSMAQCVISWKEEPLKPFTTAAKMWFIRPKNKF